MSLDGLEQINLKVLAVLVMVNCVSDMHHVNEVVCYCDKAVRLCRDVTLRIQATPAEIFDTVGSLKVKPLPAEAAL